MTLIKILVKKLVKKCVIKYSNENLKVEDECLGNITTNITNKRAFKPRSQIFQKTSDSLRIPSPTFCPTLSGLKKKSENPSCFRSLKELFCPEAEV